MSKSHKEELKNNLEEINLIFNKPFNLLITEIPDLKLVSIGKRVCSTDYSVKYFNNKNHKKFYKNRFKLEKSIKRVFYMGAFNHREKILEELKK